MTPTLLFLRSGPPFSLCLPPASFPLPTQCNRGMSTNQFIPPHPAALIPEHATSPVSLCPAPSRRPLSPPSAEPRSPSTSRAQAGAAVTPPEVLLNQGWDPGSLPDPSPTSYSFRGSQMPTHNSYLRFIQPDQAPPLVLEHHLRRGNSCRIPSPGWPDCCTLGLAHDLSKPVESSH